MSATPTAVSIEGGWGGGGLWVVQVPRQFSLGSFFLAANNVVQLERVCVPQELRGSYFFSGYYDRWGVKAGGGGVKEC